MTAGSQVLKGRREVSRPAIALEGRKILIIVQNLPVPLDRRVWQEALALRDAGATVSVICPTGGQHESGYELLDGIHVYRHHLPFEAGSRAGYFGEYLLSLMWQSLLTFRVWATRGFDTIQGCNPPDLIFLVALPYKLFGKKYIFDHHDVNPELYEAKFGKRGKVWRFLTLLERFSFMTANAVISTNESYRRVALSRGGKRADCVTVVRSGPDLARIGTVTPDPKLNNDRKYLIGYVGVMGPQEGIDLLLDAARHLVFDKGRDDIQFALVGGGPSLEEMRALSEEMNLGDHVTFLGRVSDRRLFEVLASSDVCVNPDRVNAMNDISTMNKILEYMAFAKPIVQFAVKEGRYSAGDASLYAVPNDPLDFANKIIDLLADAPLRDRMGRIGRERLETELSWERQVPKLLKVYDDVMR